MMIKTIKISPSDTSSEMDSWSVLVPLYDNDTFEDFRKRTIDRLGIIDTGQELSTPLAVIAKTLDDVEHIDEMYLGSSSTDNTDITAKIELDDAAMNNGNNKSLTTSDKRKRPVPLELETAAGVGGNASLSPPTLNTSRFSNETSPFPLLKSISVSPLKTQRSVLKFQESVKIVRAKLQSGEICTGECSNDKDEHGVPTVPTPKTSKTRNNYLWDVANRGQKVLAIQNRLETDNHQFSESSYFLSNLKSKVPFNPISLATRVWLRMLWCFVLWDFVIVPYRVAFQTDALSVSALDVIVNVIFVLDLIRSFLTGYITRSQIERRWKKVAWNYFSTWFVFDLIVAVPFDMIVYYYNENTQNKSSLRFLKILRVLRQIRIAKFMRDSTELKRARLIDNARKKSKVKSHVVIKRIFRMYASFMGRIEPVLQISSALGIGLALCHIHACVFYWIGSAPCDEDNPTWNTDWFGDPGDAWVCHDLRGSLYGRPLWAKYVRSVYWAAQTFTTVGYGDICAGTLAESVYLSYATVFGAVSFAYVISKVSTAIVKNSSFSSTLKEKMSEVRQFLRMAKLSKELEKKTLQYFEFHFSHYHERETDIMKQLPHNLRTEINRDLRRHHWDMLAKAPFFRLKEILHLAGLSTKFAHLSPDFLLDELVSRLEPLLASPGQKLIAAHSINPNLIFVWQGVLEVEMDGRVKYINPGGYIGERALLDQGEKHLYSVRVCEGFFCKLLQLSRKSFLEAMGSLEVGDEVKGKVMDAVYDLIRITAWQREAKLSQSEQIIDPNNRRSTSSGASSPSSSSSSASCSDEEEGNKIPKILHIH